MSPRASKAVRASRTRARSAPCSLPPAPFSSPYRRKGHRRVPIGVFSVLSVSLWYIFGPHTELFMQVPNTYRGGPDRRGHFGIYGGRFVAETLMPLILAVEAAYAEARIDPSFQAELDDYLEHYVGRPSPLYFAERLTRHFGGAKVYLKRDELNHTGAHKINN